MNRVLFWCFSAAVAACCTLGCSCDDPVQPKPGHTALTLQNTFTSTRWCRLQWNNDSSAVSQYYVLLRNGRDTVFEDTVPKNSSLKIIQDSLLTPGTNCTYSLYRIYEHQHWDSVTLSVNMLDTTKDDYSWDTIRIPGAVLYGVWGLSPRSVWACGGGLALHITDGNQVEYVSVGNLGGCAGLYGLSDSLIWFACENTLVEYNGHTFVHHAFNGDSLFNLVPVQFTSLWVSPDNREIFAVGGNGAKGIIVHRKADGKTWEQMESGTTLGLRRVIAFSPTNIYAVGGYSNIRGVLLHYDGIAWNTLLESTVPGSPIKVANIFGIDGSQDDSLWIGGNGIYHRTANSWEDRTPLGEQIGYIECIAAPAWNDVFACGDFGFLAHYDGEKWKIYHDYFDLGSGRVFAVIRKIGNEVFAVGSESDGGWIIHGK